MGGGGVVSSLLKSTQHTKSTYTGRSKKNNMDPLILDESTNPFCPYEGIVKMSAGRGNAGEFSGTAVLR